MENAEKKLCDEEFSNIFLPLETIRRCFVMQTKWKYNRDLDERSTEKGCKEVTKESFCLDSDDFMAHK